MGSTEIFQEIGWMCKSSTGGHEGQCQGPGGGREMSPEGRPAKKPDVMCKQ